VKKKEDEAIRMRITEEYSRREKTLLEQVANYTSFGKEGGGTLLGCPDECWIQIEHCVVSRERFKYSTLKPQTIIIDFREFNQTAFKIESYVLQGYGERASFNIGWFTGAADGSYALIKYDSGITVITTSSLPTSGFLSSNISFPTMDRLSKAWGLAFKECPGKKSRF